MELTSLHQGMKQQITTDVSNQARTSGRPVITEFTLTKYVDIASVKLYRYCLEAKILGPTSYIYLVRNSGGKMATIMTIAINNALVSEIQLQTHPNDMPTEQFKVNFTDISWDFNMQKNDTSPGGHIGAGWSVSQNIPIGTIT